jgi:hypothetical protein
MPMRVLRISLWGPDLEPLSMVVREHDMTLPLEEVVRQQVESPDAPGYVSHEILEVEEEDIAAVTLGIVRRHAEQQERERNAAMLYWWDAAQLPRLTEGGVLTATKPAPLSVDEIRDALEQLARHPHYRGQLVVSIAEDGRVVTMRDGAATVSSLFGGEHPGGTS